MALFKINSFKNAKIAKIMADCFHEPIATSNFFLENKPAESICYTCSDKNNIISILHSLPYKIKLENSFFKCSYLYGACTVPQYRKKGYMKKLIEFYEIQAKLNGFDFSALVPDNKQLENYYHKLGYENFFKIKEINLNNEQFLKFCHTQKKVQNSQNKNNCKNFYKDIEKLRLDIYNNISNILYSSKDMEYAANLYGFEGGKIISFSGGYAICTPSSKTTLEIRDFTCKNGFIPDLLHKIYINFPEYTDFKVKTSANDTFFKENYKTYFYGMIKPISNSGKNALEHFLKHKIAPAYLGLALD